MCFKIYEYPHNAELHTSFIEAKDLSGDKKDLFSHTYLFLRYLKRTELFHDWQ